MANQEGRRVRAGQFAVLEVNGVSCVIIVQSYAFCLYEIVL